MDLLLGEKLPRHLLSLQTMAMEVQPFHYGKAEEPQPIDLATVTGFAIIGVGILTLVIEILSPAANKQFVVSAAYFIAGAAIFGVPKLRR